MSQRKRSREDFHGSDASQYGVTRASRRRHGPPTELVEAFTSSLNECWQDISSNEAEVLRKTLLASASLRFLKTQTAIMLAGLVEHGKTASRKPARRREGGTPEGKRSTMTPESTPLTTVEEAYVPPPPPDDALPTFPMDIPLSYDAQSEIPSTSTEFQLRPTQRAAARRAARERRAADSKFRW